MHVLILNQYALPPGGAGITRHADLGLELVKRGHAVTILAAEFDYLRRTSTHGGALQDLGGLTFRWLDCGSYAGNDSRRIRSMVTYAIRSIVTGVRVRPRPDVIIGSSPQLLAGLSGLVLARLFRRPFIFEVRDPWPSALVDLGALRRGGLAHRTLQMIERQLYRRADRIIAVMQHIDDRVDEVGEDASKCVHIPNASALPPVFEPVPPSLRHAMDGERQHGRVVITYVGAHGVSNGLADVLDAVDLLRREDRETYDRLALFFVGGGPERASIETRAVAEGHANIHFHDAIPKSSALQAIADSDWVLVHFARADFKRFGMSANKLFDSMAVGRPVLVATPLPDTPVDTVRCGIRYEPGSARDLAGTLARAVRIPADERAAMGDRGRAEARQRYAIDVTGAELERLLTLVVEEHQH